MPQIRSVALGVAALALVLLAARLPNISTALSTRKLWKATRDAAMSFSQSTRLDDIETRLMAMRRMMESPSAGAVPVNSATTAGLGVAAASSTADASRQPQRQQQQQRPAAAVVPPPPTASPPPPPQVASLDNSKLLTTDDYLKRVPRGRLAFVSLANTAYAQLAINWALLLAPVLEAIGETGHILLAALDAPSAQQFLDRKLPTMRVGLGGLKKEAVDNAGDFRWSMGAFRAYGVTKADVILWLLREGRDVCISDVDAAWIQPPHALLASLPDADVLAGTDCLHIPEDDDRTERGKVVARCGHHIGSRWHAWYNTGVMFFRATGAAKDLTLEWRDRMASVTGEQQVDDQLTFNQLIGSVTDPTIRFGRREHLYPVAALKPDGKVMLLGNRSRKLAALPARQICTAHRYHVQQSADPGECLVLHLTFVEGWPKNPAKYWRLREAGKFPVDPESFEGKFLSFTPPHPVNLPPETHPALLRGGVRVPMPGKTTNNMGWPVNVAMKYAPRLGAHVELIDRHIAALRNAMAMATALGRTLVMPRMLCVCERAESPYGILPTCVVEGASTSNPHVCPLESVFDLARDPAKIVPLRPWTFLNASIHQPARGERPIRPATDIVNIRWQRPLAATTPLAQAANGSSVVAVAGTTGTAAPPATLSGGSELVLRHGMSDVELKAALGAAGASDARVLHVASMESSAFGGFEDVAAGRKFQSLVANHLLGGWSATWCCTSNDKPRGTIQFKRPTPLPSGPAARADAAATRPPDVPAKRVCYWVDNSCNDPSPV